MRPFFLDFLPQRGGDIGTRLLSIATVPGLSCTIRYQFTLSNQIVDTLLSDDGFTLALQLFAPRLQQAFNACGNQLLCFVAAQVSGERSRRDKPLQIANDARADLRWCTLALCV